MIRSALVFGLLTALTPPAAAYVCTRVVDDLGQETGPSLAWDTRDVTFALYAQGTNDINGDDELPVLRASFAPWGRLYDVDGTLIGIPPTETIDDCAAPPVDTCRTTNLTFREVEELSNRDVVGYDYLRPDANENLLIFRDDAWPVPAQADSVIALTTTTYNALTGKILDADIEFNSANNEFTIDDVFVETDLMNTAVHEIGHVLGLGHVTDNAEATMYDTAGRRETKKRDLDFDDRDGIVFKYPWGEDNGYCNPPVASCGFCAKPDELTAVATATASDHELGLEPQGCSAGGAEVWAGLAVALFVRGRRRRR